MQSSSEPPASRSPQGRSLGGRESQQRRTDGWIRASYAILVLALRNVARNRKRTALTVVALVLGTTVTIFIRAVLTGVDEGMRNEAIATSTGAIQVHRAGYLDNLMTSPLSLDFAADPALSSIRAVPGVRQAAPRLLFSGMASVGDESVALVAQAIDPQLDREVCPLRDETFSPGGSFGKNVDFLLSGPLTDALGVSPGVETILIAPDRDGALNAVSTQFAGSLRATGPDGRFGLTTLPMAQRLLRMEGRATEIAVAINQLDDAPRIAARLREHLGPQFEVHTWLDIVPGVKENMARHALASSIIGGVFMLLMLLGVSNTMLMSTLDRTREIGTLLALGLRRSRILELFLLEGIILGLLGSGLGALSGWAIVATLARKPIVAEPAVGMPFHFVPIISPSYLSMVVAVAAAGSALVSLYPAWRASRLRPVEALADK